MKVYMLEASEYEAQEVFKVYRSLKKSREAKKLANRLFKMKEELFDMYRKNSMKFWEDNSQLSDNDRIDKCNDTEEYKENSKLREEIRNILHKEFGVSDFYNGCSIVVKELE